MKIWLFSCTKFLGLDIVMHIIIVMLSHMLVPLMELFYMLRFMQKTCYRADGLSMLKLIKTHNSSNSKQRTNEAA